jgi:hypothetical protein
MTTTDVLIAKGRTEEDLIRIIRAMNLKIDDKLTIIWWNGSTKTGCANDMYTELHGLISERNAMRS